MLLTGVKDGSILLFDPYYWDEPYEEKDILIDLEHPRAYNREVPFRYFNREEDVLYALGKVNARRLCWFIMRKPECRWKRLLSTLFSKIGKILLMSILLVSSIFLYSDD